MNPKRNSARRLALIPALAMLAACASPPSSPHEVVSTAHFTIVNLERCLPPRDLRELLSEGNRSRKRLLRLLGSRLRPGAFPQTNAGPPEIAGPSRAAAARRPAAARIRVRVAERPGRCYTHGGGIELVRRHARIYHLTHELVHYLAGASWRPLDEGLAVYLTEKLCGPSNEAPIDTRSLVYWDLKRLEDFDVSPTRSELDRAAYDAAGSFVKFLVDRYGWDRFFELYRGLPGNYHGVYGRPRHELFEEWKASLNRPRLRQTPTYVRFRARITIGLETAGNPDQPPRGS